MQNVQRVHISSQIHHADQQRFGSQSCLSKLKSTRLRADLLINIMACQTRGRAGRGWINTMVRCQKLSSRERQIFFSVCPLLRVAGVRTRPGP